MFRHWIIGGAGTVMLCAGAVAAQAAPFANAEIQADARETSAVNQIVRRCVWRNGERYCARARSAQPRVYGYYYGRPQPEEFRTGSQAWWRAMDEEGRGGHGERP